jgi:hypothetical protein
VGPTCKPPTPKTTLVHLLYPDTRFLSLPTQLDVSPPPRPRRSEPSLPLDAIRPSAPLTRGEPPVSLFPDPLLPLLGAAPRPAQRALARRGGPSAAGSRWLVRSGCSQRPARSYPAWPPCQRVIPMPRLGAARPPGQRVAPARRGPLPSAWPRRAACSPGAARLAALGRHGPWPRCPWRAALRARSAPPRM